MLCISETFRYSLSKGSSSGYRSRNLLDIALKNKNAYHTFFKNLFASVIIFHQHYHGYVTRNYVQNPRFLPWPLMSFYPEKLTGPKIEKISKKDLKWKNLISFFNSKVSQYALHNILIKHFGNFHFMSIAMQNLLRLFNFSCILQPDKIGMF